MALMFPRLARNFIKNGYFPTDEVTLERILNALSPSTGSVNIVDPCCGEGVALAEVKSHLQRFGTHVNTYAVEIDQERAKHARGLLDHVIRADVEDVVIKSQSMGLLFLNPPYGDRIGDKADLAEHRQDNRFETHFLRLMLPRLQVGGVMVLIVPFYVVKGELIDLVASYCDQVSAFMSPETQFRQCVIFGVKQKHHYKVRQPVVKLLKRLGQGGLMDEVLPATWSEDTYRIPLSRNDKHEQLMRAVRIDAENLSLELERMQKRTLWPQLSMRFKPSLEVSHRRPLCNLGQWHLALALAAGQINGIVRSASGQTFVVKGATHKEKERSSTIEKSENPDEDSEEVVLMTDKFVPVIKAIDFTPGTTFGRIVTIR